MHMEKKQNIMEYLAPEVKVVTIKSRRMLCESPTVDNAFGSEFSEQEM
jgi:hypothetical protein